MSVSFLPVLALFVLAAVLARVAIAQPGPLWRKVVALVALALNVPVGIHATVELLGRPKPAALEWNDGVLDGATVVARELRENEAIYLWLVPEGESVPRAYALPWSVEAARELEDAMEVAEEMQTRLVAKMTAEDEAYLEDFRLTFHPVMPTRLQEKVPAEEEDPMLYDRDGGNEGETP